MRFFFIFVLLQVFSFSSFSLDKKTYYGSDFYTHKSIWKNQVLKTKLHEILKNYHTPNQGKPDSISNNCNSNECYRHMKHEYRASREVLFGDIHLEKQGNSYFITDVYCESQFMDFDFRSKPPGPFLIPDHTKINAEHTWPRSKFNSQFSKSFQLSDLHNLYPTDSSANSLRSNHPFGNVQYTSRQTCSMSKKGHRNSVDNNDYFEVPNQHKGNAARSVFYFAIRYKIKLTDVEEATLRNWHFQDPPDQFEKFRNNKVADFQKNRNPFIDFPELVDQITDF